MGSTVVLSVAISTSGSSSQSPGLDEPARDLAFGEALAEIGA
jgi:hypothetical protein